MLCSHIIIKSVIFQILRDSVIINVFVFVNIRFFFSYLYNKDNFILATFSAGRIIMTISHTICPSTARRQINWANHYPLY